MPHSHPAYPEETSRLSKSCNEMDAQIERLENQETDNYHAAMYGSADLYNLRSAADQPYYMRLLLKYDDGTVKDVCFGETANDIPLKDTYICGVGSPLRQQIQHRNVREVSIAAASGSTWQVYQLLRRQIRVEQRNITALSDVMPLADETATEAEDTDDFVQLGQEYLINQLDREASAKARSILATISERQDELMTWPTDKLLVVNGVAGSGKTAIAYHRIPTMLHKERAGSAGLNERRIAVFVPNQFLLSYLRQLLPRFGVGEVFQTTFEDWAKRVVGRNSGRQIGQLTDETASIIFDPKSSADDKKKAWTKAIIRGRQEMQSVLRQLVAEYVGEKLTALSIELPRIIPTAVEEDDQDDLDKLLDTSMFDAPEPDEPIEEEPQAPIVLTLELTSMQQIVEAWRQDGQQSSWVSLQSDLQAEVRRLLEEVLPNQVAQLATEEQQVVETWADEIDSLEGELHSLLDDLIPEPSAWETYLALVADKARVKAAVNRVFSGRPAPVAVDALYRSPKQAKNSTDARPAEPTDITELPLVLALKILLEGIQPNDATLKTRFGTGGQFQYLIVDEGQDLSPLQYALLSRYTPQGRAAIFGDLRQGIHRYRGIDSWDVVLRTLGTGDDHVEELTQTFRTTQEITALSNFVLDEVMPKARRAEAVPRPGSPVHFVRYGNEVHLIPHLTHEVRRLQNAGAKNIGIVTRSPSEAANIYQRVSNAGSSAFKVDSRTKEFEDYAGGVAIVPISVAKGLEFDAAIVVNADAEHYSPSTLYDGSLLYTCVTRGLHHLSIFAKGEFTPLLGEVPMPPAGKCPISGLEITAEGIHKPPAHTTGKARKKGQERGPGANHDGIVRTYDGRFDSTPSYEGDGSRDNPWYDH